MLDSASDENVLDTVALTGIKAAVLDGSGPSDPGLSDLRTTSYAVAVDQGWSDPTIKFATYGWDADLETSRWVDSAGVMTLPPTASDSLPKYSTDCRGNPSGSPRWTAYCIDEDEADTFFGEGKTCSGRSICGSSLWRLVARGRFATVETSPLLDGVRSTIHLEPPPAGEFVGNDLVVSLPSAGHPHANQNFRRVGPAPRAISGLRRLRRGGGGGTETYDARCQHTGANHLSILHHGRAEMVQCTAADTMEWMRTNAIVRDVPAAAE